MIAPGEINLLSTHTISASRGVETIRLSDDQTGQWVQVVKEFGVKAPGVDEWLDLAMEDSQKDPERRIRMVVSTSSGLEHACEVPVEPSRGEEELTACLLDAQAAKRLVDELTPEIRRSLTFLASALGAPGGVTRPHSLPPRLLLALSADRSSETVQTDSVKTDWGQEVGAPTKGLSIQEGRWMRLLETFRQVTPADLFAGSHLDD